MTSNLSGWGILLWRESLGLCLLIEGAYLFPKPGIEKSRHQQSIPNVWFLSLLRNQKLE